MKRFLLFLYIVVASLSVVQAQGRKAVELSTDIAMFAPAAVGAGVALVKGDYKGLLQLGEALAVSVATSYALKYVVKKERPDGSDLHSFPSNHTGFSFAGATFLLRRYGWQWGVPAYLVGGYVAWGRVYAKRHDVWDVLAGAAIGVGSGFLFSTPFAKRHDLVVSPTVNHEGNCGIYFSMKF
ncbi:MAG: phosphatase PAP2 family protein [Bacteroidaceae bacterium]|nr:phosphatase PAP2 family protein [Bacteroidaceae bacterium]